LISGQGSIVSARGNNNIFGFGRNNNKRATCYYMVT